MVSPETVLQGTGFRRKSAVEQDLEADTSFRRCGCDSRWRVGGPGFRTAEEATEQIQEVLLLPVPPNDTEFSGERIKSAACRG